MQHSSGRCSPSTSDRIVAGNEPGTPDSQLASALIVAGDRLVAEALQREIRRIFPEIMSARVGSLNEANAHLSKASVDLLLVLLDTLHGDALDLLAEYAGVPHRRGRVMVVTSRHSQRVLAMLRLLLVDGVVDLRTAGLADFGVALRMVARGERYWSTTLAERCRAEVGQSGPILQMLTPAEELVLGIIGDGCDDDSAAAKLGMRTASVQSTRRALHQKLHVQRQPDLMRRAVDLGYFAWSPEGRITRVGFSLMLTAARRRGRGNRIRQCAANCSASRRCVDCRNQSRRETPHAVP